MSKSNRTQRKIVMLVKNEFTHDSRVRKQATSLAAVGFEVTVVAVLGSNLPRREFHSGGFQVVRVGYPGLRRILGWISRNLVVRRTRSPTSAKGLEPRAEAAPVRPGGTFFAFKLLSERIFYYFAALTFVAKPRFFRATVLAHDLDTLPLGYLLSRILCGPLAYDSHELHSDTLSMMTRPVWWRKIALALERALSRRARIVVTVNSSISKIIAEKYGIPRPLVVHNVPDPREVAVAKSSPAKTVREMAELGPEARVIAYSGGVAFGRGLEVVIRSLPQLPQNFHFVVLGPGQAAVVRQLELLADRLGVGSRVRFLGAVPGPHVPYVLRSADIAIVLTDGSCRNHYLCRPNKLYESLHAGLPVIASDFPEIRKVVRDWDVGELVDPSSSEAFARAAKTLLADSSRILALKENARRAAEVLRWENEESSLVRAFASLRCVVAI